MAETWTPPAGDKLISKGGAWTPPAGDKLVTKAQPSAQPAPAAAGEMPPYVDLPDGTRMVFNPATGQYTNEELIAGYKKNISAESIAANMPPMGSGEAAIVSAANGMTFGWIDELAGMAGMDPLQVERIRADQIAAKRDAPVTSMVSSAGGNILGGYVAAQGARALPVVGPALGAAQGLGFLGKTVASGAAGAGLGALQGAGDAMPGQRVEGAGTGAMFGAAFGLAAPSIGKALGAGSKAVGNWFKRSDTGVIQRTLNISADAAKIIKTYIQNDDYAAAAEALKKAGPEAMLADSSPQASQLLDTTVAAGGPAQRVARDAVEGRANASAGRLKAAMDTALGPAPDGIKTASRDIATRTAAARAAAYDKAYATAIDYASDAGRAVEDALTRIPKRVLSAAIQEANDFLQLKAGTRARQIMAKIADDGSVEFVEMPTAQQLDFLKRALDKIVNDNTEEMTGKIAGMGVAAKDAVSLLRSAISEAVPSYKTALRLGGDKIAEENAMKIGRDLLKPSMTRERVAEVMADASMEAKIAARRGIRMAFDEAMENVKATAANPETDARAALKAVTEFSSPAARAKAVAVLGQDKASKLFAAFDEAAKQLALRANIASNSATAARTAGKAAMDAILESPLAVLKEGRPLEAARGLVQMLTEATPADRVKAMQTIYGEVARALTEKRGPEAQAALVAIQSAMAKQPITEARAKMIAKAVTAAFSALGYQSSTQRQSQ